ncbi:carbamoyl phosphate synthase small subunit [Thermoplasmatales archaeon SW_10_69_26]|nr:MAG: carbamoyl phosphate synthase small subunit [Thermoplasmatales archaeon SW_10_69_26]
MSARLVLEDGTVLEGEPFGAQTTSFGELVFNTSMTGYQEALTDPSYTGQLLMFTYPLIGNYGILPDAYESDSVKAWGCAVREACESPWHPRSEASVDEFLADEGVPGITGIDTRSVTVDVREHGVMKAAITTEEDRSTDDLLAEVGSMPSPDEDNLVADVSVDGVERWGGEGPRVVVMDYGCKHSILRNLEKHFEVYRAPWNADADEVLDLDPEGIMLSNGPGDPAHEEIMEHAVPTIRDLIGERPVYGICLGHQLMSLALGGDTFKLKFGHRGSNQPVKNRRTGRVVITSQNHGFAVDADTFEDPDLEVAETNASDGTLEAIGLPGKQAYSVQYHPEANPGPLDTEHFFNEFAEEITGGGA